MAVHIGVKNPARNLEIVPYLQAAVEIVAQTGIIRVERRSLAIQIAERRAIRCPRRSARNRDIVIVGKRSPLSKFLEVRLFINNIIPGIGIFNGLPAVVKFMSVFRYPLYVVVCGRILELGVCCILHVFSL